MAPNLDRQASNRATPDRVYVNSHFTMLDGDRDMAGTDLMASPRATPVRQSDTGSRLTPTSSIGRRGRVASLAGGGRREFTLDEDALQVIAVQPKNRDSYNKSPAWPSASTQVERFEEEDPSVNPRVKGEVKQQSGFDIRAESPKEQKRAPNSPGITQSKSFARSTEAWEAKVKSLLKACPTDAVKTLGPPGIMVKCYIKRLKDFFGYPTYKLFLDSSNTFILAARKRKKTKFSNYVMSVDADDLKRDTENVISKLKGNDKGNEYTLHQRQEDYTYSSEVCVSFGNSDSDLNAPRTILAALPSPSALMPGAERPLEPSAILDMVRSNDLPTSLQRKVMVLCNKVPEFDTPLQMYTLDFKGRVKVPSVKNFQMCLWDPNDPDQSKKGGEVILQFGKIRDDIYALDYAWPLSPQTAFAIALTSFDKKVR